MKCIIKNDLKYFFSTKLKLVIAYLITMIILAIYLVYYDHSEINIFNIAMGLNMNFNSYIYTLIYVFIITFYMYLTVDIYFKNIKIGVDNFLLRVNRKKWLISRFISIFIINIIVKTLTYIVMCTLFLLLKVSINNIILLSTTDILFTTGLSLMTITLIQLIYHSKFVAIIYLILLFFGLFLIGMSDVVSFSNHFILTIFVFIIVIYLYICIGKQTIVKSFERSF